MVKKSDTDETTLRDSSPGDESPRTVAVDPPTRLRGLFVLQERLGDGGMGAVYKALDLKRSKYDDPRSHVALKVIKPEVLREFPDAALALQREASRAMELSHPNIVRIYGFYDFDPADGACFITMELLQGKPLDALLRKHPRGLSTRHALSLLEKICSGLQYAHDRRLVHSDLKPGNIFITDDGEVRILDFGIATPLRNLKDVRVDTLYNPRQLGALTPAYASLEQWDRMSADPRDDLYSLGCIAYEMLSGEHPFGKADARKACNDAMPVKKLRKLSARQNKALRTALSFRRDARTASVDEFWSELAEASPSRVPRVAAIGVVAATAIAAAVFWTIRDRAAPTPKVEVAVPEAPVAQTSAPEASVQPPSASREFEEQCQMPANESSLAQLLDRGLQDSADLALSARPEAELKALESRIAATAGCIVALRRLDIQSDESERWLKDVEPLLRR